MITNWAKVNSNLKWLIEAYENPYFNLLTFCTEHNLDYRDILGFISIGRLISSGNLNLVQDLKRQLRDNERLIQQLELLTLYINLIYAAFIIKIII